MALSQEWFLKREIWLYRKPLDFRKQLDGLVHIVAAEIKLMPNDGTIYVFRNQNRDKLKLLLWERNGFFMGYKRLEKGRFDFPADQDGQIILNWEQFYMLLSGMPLLYLGINTQQKAAHFF